MPLKAWQRLHDARPPAWVCTHCALVAGLAAAMCDHARDAGFAVDSEATVTGALLHDIGRSVTQDIRHAHLGADILRADGDWPDSVVRMVERHTGAGIEPDEAAALGLPLRTYLPATLEERIVAHADNLFSGDKRWTLKQVVAKYEARHLGAAARRIEVLHRDLEGLLGVDLDRLQGLDLGLPDLRATNGP